MTQAKLKEAKLRAREWRKKNPKRAIKASADWKARNPDWWKGRKYVQLLTSALVNGNAKSKVFSMAGVTLDGWIELAPCLQNGGLGSLVDGHKLEPIKPWRECHGTYSIFLAPGNFKLVSK